jgi:hypothetical protein
VHVSIWIFFLDVNWKHKSNLFEITIKWFKFAYVCMWGCNVVGIQRSTILTHWGGIYNHLGLIIWMFSKKKNQSVIISKTMIFEKNQYNFKI